MQSPPPPLKNAHCNPLRSTSIAHSTSLLSRQFKLNFVIHVTHSAKYFVICFHNKINIGLAMQLHFSSSWLRNNALNLYVTGISILKRFMIEIIKPPNPIMTKSVARRQINEILYFDRMENDDILIKMSDWYYFLHRNSCWLPDFILWWPRQYCFHLPLTRN